LEQAQLFGREFESTATNTTRYWQQQGRHSQ
jgi:hypothetical protein